MILIQLTFRKLWYMICAVVHPRFYWKCIMLQFPREKFCLIIYFDKTKWIRWWESSKVLCLLIFLIITNKRLWILCGIIIIVIADNYHCYLINATKKMIFAISMYKNRQLQKVSSRLAVILKSNNRRNFIANLWIFLCPKKKLLPC